jgi:hypothetical protein
VNIKNVLASRYAVAGNPLMTERRIELLAVLIALVLVIQLLYGFVRLQFLSEPESIVPSLESLEFTGMASVAPVDAKQALEIVSRPLFWPSRRPISATDEAEIIDQEEAEQADDLAKIKVLGIFAGGQSAGVIALVKGKKQRIQLNEQVIGWTLQSVEVGHAVFVNDGTVQEVTLEISSM